MLYGSCLCGTVTYEIAQEAEKLIFCHCSLCRKFTGSAFSSVSVVAASAFNIVTGQSYVRAFERMGTRRHFCQQCGSGIYACSENLTDSYILYVGTLDTPLYPQNKVHLFLESKADWDETPEA